MLVGRGPAVPDDLHNGKPNHDQIEHFRSRPLLAAAGADRGTMSMAKKREEKLMKSLRDFMKTPENKKCADCQEKVIWANTLRIPHHCICESPWRLQEHVLTPGSRAWLPSTANDRRATVSAIREPYHEHVRLHVVLRGAVSFKFQVRMHHSALR